MKRFILCLFILTLGYFSQAQDSNYKSIHEIEWEEHFSEKTVAISKASDVTIHPLVPRDSSSNYLSHAVFGYLPDWKRNSAPPYFQYDLLSHIALFDFTVSTQGDIIGYPSGWPNDWISTMNNAHDNGVKLIMCVVEFNDDDINALIHDTSATQNFYQNLESIINTYNLDGVNIDFEGPKTADRGAPMNLFMRGLSDYLKSHIGPEQEISFAGPAVNWSGWDLPGLVDACDYVFIMGYAYWWSGSSTTGPTAPITGASYCLEQTLASNSHGYGACDPSKLILGLPYYGLKWKVSASQKATVNASTLASGKSTFYASTMELFASHGRHWSSKYEDPFTYYKSGDDWYQAWCNDAIALDAKEKLVFEYGLMGTGMWALGYDEEKTALWNILRENFLTLNDSLVLDNFENGKGHFYRPPTYSGSTSGISSDSYTAMSQISFSGDSSLKIVLIDDESSSEDWNVRLLSGSGATTNNIQFPRERLISFACKSSQNGCYVSLMIDDEDGQLEQSIPIALYGDDQWHSYSVRLDSAELWQSYYQGTGAIDADQVSLDALLFFCSQQSSNRTIYLDDIRAITIDDPIEASVENPLDQYHILSNYPNPFNPSTTFQYCLEKQAHVKINIYDINGRFVENLVDAIELQGEHSLNWHSKDLPAGIYLASLTIENTYFSSHKLIILK